jgi:hypothetical protein
MKLILFSLAVLSISTQSWADGEYVCHNENCKATVVALKGLAAKNHHANANLEELLKFVEKSEATSIQISIQKDGLIQGVVLGNGLDAIKFSMASGQIVTTLNSERTITQQASSSQASAGAVVRPPPGAAAKAAGAAQ